MYMKTYPCVYMRGGTSKAVIFHRRDLPEDERLWDEIFLKVMGSPDVKQIDGMGGTVSSTSKVAVIDKSEQPGIDVDYSFFQVNVNQAFVDRRVNCGNISSAVGPFAIDEGLVEAVEPVTTIRIRNTNTGQIIEARVRVEQGHAMVHGDEQIFGVPGTGSRIDMKIFGAGGATTGKLFPTGNRRDVFEIPGWKNIEVTVIDASTAAVLVRAEDLGLKGTELLELNENRELMQRLEWIRGIAAQKCGFVQRWEDARELAAAVPDVTIVAGPKTYASLDQTVICGEDMDICSRTICLGLVHKAYPVTGGIATGAAAMLEGTVAYDLARKKDYAAADGDAVMRIGHPSGILEVGIEINDGDVESVSVVRTARRIMKGFVYVRD